ncbi:MAG: glycerol-3-phosphate 1-O-acyltransferase PlsY [Solobacterium sp.]|nr:glycerol-3-phosphate 1-O-acyltransferase PlsY [Solobacterium sp.]
MLKTLIVIVIAYLFGSVPWALVIGKVFYHKDVRQYGSGNLGASNAGRVLGKPAAVAVTILDAVKALLAMIIANAIQPSAVCYAGLACCIGHCFPVFAQFKGGKAVAASYGFIVGVCALITRSWLLLIVPVACFFIILYICRMVSVSSILSLLIAAVMSFILKSPAEVSVCLVILWLFVTYRHRSNISRIRSGTESKIKWMGEKHGKN